MAINTNVSVIAPYSAQARELRKMINGRTDFTVNVNTVDVFQGKESDVVIFSLTRTHGTYDFLADSRRLNVALSRAKNKLVIIGNIEYALNNSLLKSIISKCPVKRI